MSRKSKGSVTASMTLFVSSGILASVLGVRQYDRVTTEESWVTSTTAYAGQVISASMLKRARIDEDRLGIDDPRRLIGQRLAVNKPAGESIAATDLEPPVATPPRSLAEYIPEGRVIYSLQPGSNATVPYSQLRAGDRLDVLVRGRRGVRTAATDVRLVGVMRPRSGPAASAGDKNVASLLQQKAPSKSNPAKTTLVLAVSPEHVYPLAQISKQDTISLVLHSAYDVAAGRTVSVTPQQTEHPVEVVAGLSRSTVYVKP